MAKKKLIFFGILLPLFYISAYGYFRHAGDIIHFQNLGEPQGVEVKAPDDPWDDVLAGMAADRKSIFLTGYAYFNRVKPGLLNDVFWPVRKLECGYWNAKAPKPVALDVNPG